MDTFWSIVHYASLTIGVLAVIVFMGLTTARIYLDYGRARLDEQLHRGISSPHVGKLARVREVVDPGYLWVELDGRVWPAKLPPFTPAPFSGGAVRVINVVSEVLIVRPLEAGAPQRPSDPA